MPVVANTQRPKKPKQRRERQEQQRQRIDAQQQELAGQQVEADLVEAAASHFDQQVDDQPELEKRAAEVERVAQAVLVLVEEERDQRRDQRGGQDQQRQPLAHGSPPISPAGPSENNPSPSAASASAIGRAWRRRATGAKSGSSPSGERHAAASGRNR